MSSFMSHQTSTSFNQTSHHNDHSSTYEHRIAAIPEHVASNKQPQQRALAWPILDPSCPVAATTATTTTGVVAWSIFLTSQTTL